MREAPKAAKRRNKDFMSDIARILALALGMAAAGWAFGQSARTLPAQALATPPTIDGAIGADEWKDAALAEKFWEPNSGKPAEFATQAWIGYDQSAIYVAFRCFDPDPSKIVAREFRHGASLDGEDSVALVIDPFYTRQDEGMNFFLVNAIGTRNEQFSSGRAAKREWRGEWDAKAKRDGEGWSVEMRIPWGMLNYPAPGPNGVKMSINFARSYGRGKNEELWSNLTSNYRPEFEGTWEGVKPPKPPAPKPQFLGYTLLTGDGESKVVKGDAGLDIKFQPTQQMTLIGALNPDFQNVEQQVESVQFTRSERFLGDSRPFFAEGSSQFSMTSQYGIGRLFYSRRIMDFDLGGKAYGRLNKDWSVAALATGGSGSTSGAFNIRRVLPNGGDTGIFGTVHQDEDRDDTTVGLTFNRRLGNYWLNLESVRERDRDKRGKAYSYNLGYDIPNFYAEFRHTLMSEHFDPALALLYFRDKVGDYLFLEYSKSQNDKWLQDIEIAFFADKFKQESTGDPLLDGYDFFGTFLTRTKQEIEFSFENRLYEGVRDRILSLGLSLDPDNRFRNSSFGVDFGKRGGKDYRFYSAGATRRIGGHLDIGLRAGIEEFEGRSEQFIATVGWEFDARRSLTGRWVQSEGQTNGYVAFRNGGFAGNEVYVILGDPNAEKFQRKLTIKLVWPF